MILHAEKDFTIIFKIDIDEIIFNFFLFFLPGCENTDLWSDEYWECICRQFTITIYHHSGLIPSGSRGGRGVAATH